MLALIGVLGIAVFIYLLSSNKTTMVSAFVVPIILVPLLCGASLEDLSAYIMTGVSNTASLGVMAAFAVLFFTLMNQAGVFDVVVGAIMKRLKMKVFPALLAAFLVAIASNLDGQAPSTILVTIPALYPVFKKLKIRPVLLAYVLSIAVGIWNFLPWGAVTLTNSVVMGLDVLRIWDTLYPSVLIMTGIAVAAIFLVAKREDKRIAAGLNDQVVYSSMFAEEAKERTEREKKLLPFNLILTLVTIVILFLNIVNTAVVFMTAYTVAVLVNFRTQKEAMKHFEGNASTALMIALAMILGGVFGNVLSSCGVLTAMIEAIVSVFPAAWSPWLLPIFGVLAFPLGWLLALTAYHFGVLPVIHGVAATYGYTAIQTVSALAPGYAMTYMVCPMMPSTYLLLGLMKLDMKEHCKYSVPRLFVLSLIFLLVNILLGNVPIITHL